MVDQEYPDGFVPAGEPVTSLAAAQQQVYAAQQANAPQVQQPAQPEPGQVQAAQTTVAQPADNTQPVAEPANPEPVNFDDAALARALEVASGGRLKSPVELQGLFEAQQQKALLEATVADLKAKVEVNPFANPVAQKVNELLAKGASGAEVEHFIRLQNTDTSKLDQLSAVRLAVQSEFPEFDAAMVDAYMSDSLGLSNFIEGDASDVTASDRVRMAKAHRDAIQKIESLKVQSETPASFQAQAQAAQVKQQQLQAYQSVAETIANSSKTVAFDIDGIGKFEFNVPQEFLAAATSELAKMGTGGAWSLDQAGVPQAQAIFKSMVGATYLDQIITSATKHAEAVTRAAVLREMSGPAPSVGNKMPGTQAPAPAPSNGGWGPGAPDPSFFTKNW